MITVVFGLPASGKSFFAKHLAKDLRAAYLNTDIVREELRKKGEYDPDTNHLVYDHLKKRVLEEMEQFTDVVTDGTFRKKKWRKEFSDTLKAKGGKVNFIEMTAKQSTIRQRMEKKRPHSEADFKVYLQVRNQFEPMNEEHLVLSSDQLHIKTMLRIAKNYLYEQRRNSQD